MDLSEIATRINHGGIINQILFIFWIFIMIPFGIILAIFSIKNANKRDNNKDVQEINIREE